MFSFISITLYDAENESLCCFYQTYNYESLLFFSSSRSVLGREKEKSVCEFIKDNDKKNLYKNVYYLNKMRELRSMLTTRFS